MLSKCGSMMLFLRGLPDNLTRKELKGTRIEARRYRHRTPLRDRRRNGIEYDQPDNRREERRRSNIKIDLVGT